MDLHEGCLSVLKELNEKYKKNSSLSAQDTEKYADAIEMISLSSEPLWGEMFECALNGPPEQAMAGVAGACFKLGGDAKRSYISSFVQHETFKKNQQYKSVYRGSILLGKVLNEGEDIKIVEMLVKAIAYLLCSNANGKELSAKGVQYIRKEFLLKAGKKIKELDFSNVQFSMKEACHVQRLLAYAAFGEPCHEVPWNFQVYSLKVISTVESKIYLELHDIDLINKCIQTWEQSALAEFDASFGTNIKFAGIVKGLCPKYANKSVEDTRTVKVVKPDASKDLNADNVTSTGEKGKDKFEVKQDSSNASELIVEIGKCLKRLETENLNLREKADKYDFVVRELEEERKFRDKEQRNNEELRLLVSDLEKKNNELRDLEARHRENVQLLHGIKTREDSNSLIEFKNKLGAQLKYEYLDFKDILESEMSVDIGENLRIQLNKVFNILKKQGVLSEGE